MDRFVDEFFAVIFFRKFAKVFARVVLPLFIAIIFSLNLSLDEGVAVEGAGALTVLSASGISVHGFDVEVREGFRYTCNPVLLNLVETSDYLLVFLEIVVELNIFSVVGFFNGAESLLFLTS